MNKSGLIIAVIAISGLFALSSCKPKSAEPATESTEQLVPAADSTEEAAPLETVSAEDSTDEQITK